MLMNPPLKADQPVVVNLTALYGARVDLRLFVRPGDEVLYAGAYWRVNAVEVIRSNATNFPWGRIKPGWDAIAISTEGGTRYFGYPAKTLPKEPVTKRRPLF